MECFVPGRLLIGPDPETGGSDNLIGELRDLFRGDFDLDFTFADILNANEIFPETVSKSALPFVGRVPEGSEWDFAEKLDGRPGIKAAMPDFTVRPEAIITLNAGAILASLKQIGGEPKSAGCGTGCRIAVLDSGIDPNLLLGANVSSSQLDARNPRSALKAPTDATGHGTTVAAIIAAVAPGAEIVPVKVLDGTGSISNVLVGLYLARQAQPSCDLVNLSLSIDCWSNSCPQCAARAASISQPQLQFLFASALSGAGDVAAIAAGRRNSSSLAAPAIFPDVIAVGAFDYTSGAPGTFYPNVAPTRYVMAPCGQPTAQGSFGDTGAAGLAKYLEGTSFATAFVTGFAARVVCHLKNPGCGSPLKQTGTPPHRYLPAILAELVARCDQSFPAYDPKHHGAGALRF